MLHSRLRTLTLWTGTTLSLLVAAAFVVSGWWWVWLMVPGGPLDGIKLSVLQRDSVSPSMGFCTLTDSGPVQVLYRDAGHGRRVFESVARVGC